MSFDRRFELPTFEEDIDLSECDTCKNTHNFECGTVGYCINKEGAPYIISKLLSEKGYKQPNLDWGCIGITEDENNTTYKQVPGIEIYRKQVPTFIANMKKLGYECSTYSHPYGKRYLQTVIIGNGVDPLSVAHVLLKLDVIS